VPMTASSIAVVTAALTALGGVCLVFALRPDIEPLGLGDRQRSLYVYAAEVFFALVGLHIWLTMPWLFQTGLVRRFWMFIVMLVAFVGAGLSELFHRRRVPVLSIPLENTALALPLLPAAGFWFMPEMGPGISLLGQTPLLWFFMGSFYGAMAVGKRSFLLGLLSVASGNMGLWVALHSQGLTFFDRPQLWLIPVALAVLVVEHLDRQRLSRQFSTGLRYLALSTIYVSSSTEFLRDIGESVWLPLVLVALSVLGVLAGTWLQIRSYIYLGMTFLTVAIGRMIVYAAFQQGHTWVFFLFCIVLGACIIALFALREKRGKEMWSAVEKFRQWDK